MNPIMTAGVFFTAIIAGLILAGGFQLLLTSLSVATGLNMLGGNAVKQGDSTRTDAGAMQTMHRNVRKISGAFGFWALVTASVSLFFASMLAVRLGAVYGNATGATLGIVIWALFFLATAAVESFTAYSLTGSLFKFAAAGLKSAYAGISSVFKSSPAKEAGESAAAITRKVNEEIFGSSAQKDITAKISGYINQLRPNAAQNLIGSVLSAAEMKIVQTPDWQRSFSAYLQNTAKLGAEKVQDLNKRLKDALSGAETAAEGVMPGAGVPEKEAKSVRERFENYLRATGKSELNPEGIKNDLRELITNPGAGFDALRSRVSGIDRSTITAVLSQRKDMTPEEARRVVDRVDQVLKEITQNAQHAKTELLSRVRAYLDSLGRPELGYEGIKNDLQTLFHDPKAGLEELLEHARAINRDSIKALVASRKDISPEQAERIISSVEAARDNFIGKVRQAKEEAQRRMQEAGRAVLEQADEVRQTAATAAWWMCAAAVVSGLAAALGGMAGAL
jgi:plasmid maintenance system antidote protein VapI